MEENKMARGLMIGFIAGSVIGGIIALLYAPKSGKELRNDIKLKKDEFLDDTAEYMQIAKTKANDLINEGKKKSEMLIQEAKKKANSLLDDANKLLSSAKDKASGKMTDAKEKISSESDRIKDAFKAGVEAYKDEKKKS